MTSSLDGDRCMRFERMKDERSESKASMTGTRWTRDAIVKRLKLSQLAR
jgi:hypothetical protein